jgi:hypothetical protein
MGWLANGDIVSGGRMLWGMEQRVDQTEFTRKDAEKRRRKERKSREEFFTRSI